MIKHLRILIEQDGDLWVAQCLEHDLATQASSRASLDREVERMLWAHVATCDETGVTPFHVPPSPTDVWRRYESAPTVGRAGLPLLAGGYVLHLEKRCAGTRRD